MHIASGGTFQPGFGERKYKDKRKCCVLVECYIIYSIELIKETPFNMTVQDGLSPDEPPQRRLKAITS